MSKIIDRVKTEKVNPVIFERISFATLTEAKEEMLELKRYNKYTKNIILLFDSMITQGNVLNLNV